MTCSRWIAVCADVFEHEALSHGPYDRRSAWLWLIANAAWKSKRVSHKGKPLQLERGQVLAGRRHLAETWGWGEKQVRNFLEMLRDQKMIEGGQSNGHFANVITICNYEKYQTATDRANKSKGQSGASAGPVQGQTFTTCTTLPVREETPTGHHQQDAARDAPKAADAKRVDSHDLYNRLVDAANGALCPMAATLGMMAVSEPIGWLAQGADLELDILPAVKTVGHRAPKGSIKTWSYFRQPVAEAKARREKGLPPVNIETGKPVIRCSPGTMRHAKPAPEAGHA